MFKAKLSFKFYIIALILLAMVLFAWEAIYFLNTNEIMMEDEPMDPQTKSVATIFISAIISTWTLSLFTVIRQIVLGYAFYMDENGIHNTATGLILFSLILVMPIKCISYDAILDIVENKNDLCIKIDKSKVQTFPIFKPFIRGEYHFFSALKTVKTKEVKAALDSFMNK